MRKPHTPRLETLQSKLLILLVVPILVLGSRLCVPLKCPSQKPVSSPTNESINEDLFQPRHSILPSSGEFGLSLEAMWNPLYQRGDCLTGAQDYLDGRVGEGSVFRKREWKEFFNLDPNLTTPFLLQFADSQEDSGFHVCPFENAYKGEFVFYVLQHIHGSNWFEAPLDDEMFEEARRLHEERRQDAFRLVLEDDSLREALKSFYRSKTDAGSK